MGLMLNKEADVMEVIALDEAIHRCEEVAKENREDAEDALQRYNLVPNDITKQEHVRCKQCAAEYQQLVGWLKNYKRLLEREPCEDAISRQAAIDAIKKIHPVDTEYDCTLYDKIDVMYVLKDLPSVPPKRKTGHWIHHKETSDCTEHWECSQCHRNTMTYPFSVNGNDYDAMFLCPKCGAVMIESEDKE